MLFPALLVGMAVALLLATFIPLLRNLTDDGPSLTGNGGPGVVIDGTSSAVCIATVSTPQYADYDGCAETAGGVASDDTGGAEANESLPPWDFCVDLTADRIDYDQGRLTGHVALHFPQAFVRELTDLEGNPVLDYSQAAGSYLLVDAADAEASFLYVRVIGLDGRESVLEHVPFNAISNVEATAPIGVQKARGSGPCRDEYRVDIEIELPLAVHPQAYPYDRYSSTATFELVVPPGLSVGIDRYSFGTLVPYTLHIGSGAALSSMSLEVTSGSSPPIAYANPARGNQADQINLLRLNLALTRDSETRLFVLAALAVPFALYVALLSLVLNRRADDLGLGLLGIVAGFLSVLPLRQVLVPAEVPGLTRVDFILGFQLTLMIATFLILRVHSWQNGRPEQTISADDD